MKTRALKVLILLLGVVAMVWGGLFVTLGFVGESAVPLKVHVRRTGGERDESTPNRYTYSIGYEFVTREGVVVSGHAQAVGSSTAVKTPRRIRHLAAMPRINAPEDQCGISLYSVALLGIGLLISWSILPSRKKPARPSHPALASPKSCAPPSKPRTASQAADAQAWIRRYRKNSRRYAWGFFVALILGIGTLIRVELGEFDTDWFLATGFAVTLTWILAIWSRGVSESSWEGVVTMREVRRVGGSQSSDTGSVRVRHIIHVQTDRGKHHKVRVGADLFDAYLEGARVRKIAGLSFPVPDTVDPGTAFCPVCGNRLRGATETCPSCRAPVFDFAELTSHSL